jgi:hypothetical protein
VTDEERVAAEDAAAVANGEVSEAAAVAAAAGGGSDSSGGGAGDGEGLDRAARLHAKHPDKYDRYGQIRESFLLHHLPKPPLTCPKIKGVMPTLLGLPVMLPDIVSHR